MTDARDELAAFDRPIIGIENRTPQEVHDILKDRARALVARLAAQPAGAWRPIAELHMREGDQVLGCSAKNELRVIEWNEWDIVWYDHHGLQFFPAYWQPLPAPPSPAGDPATAGGER